MLLLQSNILLETRSEVTNFLNSSLAKDTVFQISCLQGVVRCSDLSCVILGPPLLYVRRLGDLFTDDQLMYHI